MLDHATTYLVQSDEDRSVLVALWPKLDGKRLEWFDTVRDRGFHVQSSSRDADKVEVKTARATYRFRPLTAELYRDFVQSKVDGRPELPTNEDVQAFYQQFTG